MEPKNIDIQCDQTIPLWGSNSEQNERNLQRKIPFEIMKKLYRNPQKIAKK